MEKYIYLILNILTISFPLVRSFENRIQFARKWHALFPAIITSGLIFLIWDHYFTVMGVWGFNPNYLVGLYLFELPLEEWLFFLTVPFACVFIYEVLNYFFKKDILANVSKPITFILIMIFLILGLANLDKWYTAMNFLIATAMLSVHYVIYQGKYLGRFYLTYLVHLLPFLLINGVLTGSFIKEPIVWYNNSENLAIRIFTIPIEDTVYSFTLLLMNITIYESLLRRKTIARVKSL